MKKWRLQAAAILLGGGLALGTPASAFAEVENSTVAEAEQKEESESEPEKDVKKPEAEDGKDTEKEPESEPEEDVKEPETEDGKDTEKEPESEPEEDVKEPETDDSKDAEKEPESKPEEDAKEPSEDKKTDADKPGETQPEEKVPEEVKPDETLPEEEPEKTHPSEARIQEIIQWINTLPEGSDENFDAIQERYDEIQLVCEEIDQMSEEERARIINLQKLMNLMDWTQDQMETTAMSGTMNGTIAWSLDDAGTLRLTGRGGIGDANSYSSSKIPWNKFKGKIKRIEIGEGILWIGDGAFSGTSVSSIAFPSTLTRICPSAFRQCKELTNVAFPSNLKWIDRSAFIECENLSQVYFDENLLEIGNKAFSSCKLENVTIPGSVKSIGQEAFSKNSIANLVIPKGVETIGGSAFASNPNLQSVRIPGSMTEVSMNIFKYCDQLQKVILEDGVCSISLTGGPNHSLSYLQIPATVTSISHSYYPYLTIYGVHGSYAETYAWNRDVSFVALPAVSRVSNTCTGSHVYWTEAPDASLYYLYRSTSKDGTYITIAATTSTNYTDRDVKSGGTYYYKVRASMLGSLSDAMTAKEIIFVETPDIALRVNRSTGIGLSWNWVKGATGYAIYRRNYAGNAPWVRIATIMDPSKLSWVDTSVKNNNGSQYRYTVRALAGSERKILSGCRNTGRTMVRLVTPVITKTLSGGSKAVKVTWTQNNKADGYEVRFMQGQSVKTYTVGGNQNLYRTVTGLTKGATYKVQVRSYKKVSGVGTFYSAWSAPQNVTVK